MVGADSGMTPEAERTRIIAKAIRRLASGNAVVDVAPDQEASYRSRERSSVVHSLDAPDLALLGAIRAIRIQEAINEVVPTTHMAILFQEGRQIGGYFGPYALCLAVAESYVNGVDTKQADPLGPFPP